MIWGVQVPLFSETPKSKDVSKFIAGNQPAGGRDVSSDSMPVWDPKGSIILGFPGGWLTTDINGVSWFPS